MSAVFLVASAFLASAVEMVEALTIVLAVGVTRDWRSSLTGVGVAPVAAAAIVLVTIAGIVAHRPLARVPENTMKFAVGAMLTTFGIFWATEGAGAHWPGGDASLPAVLAFVVLLSFGLVTTLRRRRRLAIA